MTQLKKIWDAEETKAVALRAQVPGYEMTFDVRARLSNGESVKFRVVRYDEGLKCFIVRFAMAIDGKFDTLEEYLDDSHILSFGLRQSDPNATHIVRSPGVQRIRRDGHKDRISGVKVLPGTT